MFYVVHGLSPIIEENCIFFLCLHVLLSCFYCRRTNALVLFPWRIWLRICWH